MRKVIFYSLVAISIVSLSFMLLYEDKNDQNYKKTINGISYELGFIPNKHLIEKEILDSKEEYEIVADRYKDHCYFKLNISSEHGQNILNVLNKKFGEKEVEEKLRLLSFHSKKELKLKMNNAESNCSLYHLDRTFVEAKGLELMIVFNVQELKDEYINNNSNIAFEFNAEILGDGLIKFDLPSDIIKQLVKV